MYVYVTLGVDTRASASNKLGSVTTYGSLVGRNVFVYTDRPRPKGREIQI